MESTETKKKKKTKYIFCRNNLFKWGYLYVKSFLTTEILLHANGTHLISAYMGGGKTLLMSHIINGVDKDKYFFLTNLDEFYQENVYYFNLKEMFVNGEQVKSVPLTDKKGRRLYAMIFDEINLNFNRRENKKTSYNDLFMGLIEFVVSSRQQGVPRLYFIGQKLELQDTQIISLLKYNHDIIKCRKFAKYKPFNDTGNFIFYPVKLKIIHRIKSTNDEFIDVKKEKIKIIQEDYESYNTAYLGTIYSKLPKMSIGKNHLDKKEK